MAKSGYSKPIKIIGIGLFIFLGISILLLHFVSPKLESFLSNNSFIELKGDAMVPLYKNGQFWVIKSYSAGEAINRNDVVAYKHPNDTSRLVFKRIVALPGESVMLKEGDFYVNDSKLEEPYTNGTKTYGATFLEEGETVVIPKNNYFVLGDNRPYSADSREHGFVPHENIKGKLTKCYKNCD